MPHDYFCRVTLPYEKIASMVSLWACRSEKLVCYEHVGAKTEKVHCHILIKGSVIEKKQLRNIAGNSLGINNVKGNENMSFKSCDDNWKVALTYMTKGNLNPKYIKGYEMSDADEWKSKWVEPARYEKRNTAELLYNSFEECNHESMFEDMPQDPEYTKFDRVRYVARAYAFQRNSMLWTQKAVNDYKMLTMTYCFRHSISIPQTHKFGKEL